MFLVFVWFFPPQLSAEPWDSEATEPYLLALSLGALAVEAIKKAAG